MKREVRYTLTEEEITCIGDIRKSKDAINRVINNIDNINKIEIVNALQSIDERLATALEKLTID